MNRIRLPFLAIVIVGCGKTDSESQRIAGKEVSVRWPVPRKEIGTVNLPNDLWPRTYTFSATINESDGLLMFQLFAMEFQSGQEFNNEKSRLIESYLSAAKRDETARTDFRHPKFEGVRIEAKSERMTTRHVCFLHGQVLFSISVSVSGEKQLSDPRVDEFLNSLIIDGDRIADSIPK